MEIGRPELIKIELGRKPRAIVPVGIIFLLLALTIIIISIRFILPPFISYIGV